MRAGIHPLPSLLFLLPAIAFFVPSESLALDPRLISVNDWLYVLQHDLGATPAVIAATEFDLVVMDYSADGSEGAEFSPAEIAAIKASGKIVLSYMSIGEAEIQRFYWENVWNDDPDPDPDAPSWLGPFNPSFPDNYKVRYWESEWQDIVFGTTSGPAESYLDRIIDAGFDGVYLDIIDAFQFWSDDVPERTRLQARTDMANFVQAMAEHARVTRGVSDFLVFPQNGSDIIYDNGENVDALGLTYLGAIDGIGAEDIFYDELTAQPAPEVAFITTLLDLFRAGGDDTRLVLAVDYVWNASNPGGGANVARYNDFETKSLERSYIPYAAVRDRELDDVLIVPATGGLIESQPKENSSSAREWRRYEP